MIKRIKKIIIKWSLEQIINMYHSKNDFGDHKEYGIQELVDFTDGELMIKIHTSKENETII